MTSFAQLPDWRAELDARLTDTFRDMAKPVRILEAGGGKTSRFTLPKHCSVTLCDINPAAIAENRDADEKILADVETHDFGACRFDVVVLWDVLEHLRAPQHALRKLITLLSPGGVLLVRGPVLTSFQGVATRLTPHAVHVAYLKRIAGLRRAGEPGHAPFPTVHAKGADDKSVIATLQADKLRLLAHRRFVGPHMRHLRRKSKIGYAALRAASLVTQAATLGVLGSMQSDFYLLASASKEASPRAQP